MAKLVIDSSMNSRQYKRGVKEMKNQNSRFGGSLGGIKGKIKGAFGVAAVLAFIAVMAKGVASLINFGSKLTDLAAQADVNVEKLQKWKRAVIDAGGDVNQLSNALIQLKAKQGDVLSGNKEYTQSFELLGITTKDLAELNTEQLFERITVALTESGNAAKQYNATLEILGKRGGGKLIEALNLIGGAADSANADLKVLSNENAQILDKMADKWAQLGETIKVTGATFVANAAKFFAGSGFVDDRIEAQEAQAELATQSRLQQAKDLAAETAAENRKKIEEEITAELKKQAGIDSQIAKQLRSIEKSVKVSIEANQFSRIGGSAGGGFSQALQMERRRLEIEMKQSDYLKEIAANTKDAGGLAP